MKLRHIRAILPYNLFTIAWTNAIIFWLWHLADNDEPDKMVDKVVISAAVGQLLGLASAPQIGIFGISVPKKEILSKIIKIIEIVGGSLLIFHLLIIALGAPFVDNFMGTLCLSGLLTSLTTIPAFVLTHGKFFEKMFMKDPCKDHVDTFAVKMTYLTIFGCWLGAFPLALDWNRPWQRYPVTCIVGSLLANLISHTISAALGIGHYMRYY